jgi:hypothetical protein
LLKIRLENQKLTGSRLEQPEDVVGWLGAVQAQDFTGAKWGLALRARNLSDEAVERAFTEGRILRTHVLRPTWHFVRRDDIRWLLALTGPRVQRMNRGYARTLGLDDQTLTRARRVVERVLAGAALTREDLSAALRRARLEVTGQRLAHLLMDLELQALICSGPRRGKQFTYALLDERVPPARPLSRDEALAELTTRYYRSHGPATVKDFVWWSGLTSTDAKAGVALTGVKPLVAPPSLQRAANAHYLLPNYDEYLIAYRDRSAVIDPDRARNLGVFTSREHPHHLVIDGRVAGSWKRTISTTAITIAVWPYRRLAPRHERAVRAQAARYARFLNVPCDVQIA